MASKIAKFYAGRSVFITGGLGFVGKQIVEKLLRSCPEIDNIYLLIRNKKGHSVQQRLTQSLNSPIFDVLKVKQPQFSKKIIPVAGDVLDDFLGVSDADHNRMSSNVSMVIHSAATLRFDEPLRVAVDMNVLGVRRALDVSKQLPKLEAFVHISTAYSQAHILNGTIEEKVYDPPMSTEDVINLTRSLSDEDLEVLVPHLLKKYKRPNTYTLTKAIAEKLVERERGHVPASICRPAVVVASQEEPFPGWTDNVTAANGVYVGFGTGTIRCLLSNYKGTAYLGMVPVDRVANGIIVSGWQTAINKSESKVSVYTIANDNIHTIRLMSTMMMKNARSNPYSLMHPGRYSWTGFPTTTSNRFLHYVFNRTFLGTKYYFEDALMALTGKKSNKFFKYERSQQLAHLVDFFTCNGFLWDTNGLKKTYQEMNDIDKKEFNTTMDDVDIESFYENWWIGSKKYALKDPACAQTTANTDSLPLPTAIDIRAHTQA